MIRLIAFALLTLAAPLRAEPLTVFAAASLGGALDAVAEAWAGEVTISYAGSATLARQIEAGAPADVVILASTDWMDHLVGAGAVEGDSVTTPLANRLVLAVPVDTLLPDRSLRAALDHLPTDARIATGLTEAVPAGIYARQTLEALELWNDLSPRLVQTENVRVALALVARAEVAAAFVYVTDAMAEPRVAIAAHVPPGLHDPIRYPAARVSRSDHPEAAAFLDHLSAAHAVFAQHGYGRAE